ncbi:YbaB/EbfC family nucleoid-associated protein [Paracoccus marinus]|uniref:YbaB/EbfC family nucleoid-associated protein n=1 Tax=Paracoccus marinus TaxID=288426 RepID=UPI00103EEA66|nr:YbaB/EbfC family nucleoid-associated protein [Paracoccus marinus]GLS80767.1 nucleoid-associated protein YbaB [Paracoccus marinus]
MKNPFGGMGDLSKMMQAAREMQDKVEGLQKSLDEITVTGEAGAGLVRATATAKGDLTGLDIDPSIFVASEKQVVEDLILAAIKDAQRRAADRAKQETERLAGGMGLPPGMKLPF